MDVKNRLRDCTACMRHIVSFCDPATVLEVFMTHRRAAEWFIKNYPLYFTLTRVWMNAFTAVRSEQRYQEIGRVIRWGRHMHKWAAEHISKDCALRIPEESSEYSGTSSEESE